MFLTADILLCDLYIYSLMYGHRLSDSPIFSTTAHRYTSSESEYLLPLTWPSFQPMTTLGNCKIEEFGAKGRCHLGQSIVLENLFITVLMCCTAKNAEVIGI